MLIRFATLLRDAASGHRQGLLVAAHTLRDEGDLSVAEHADLQAGLNWFTHHLHAPEVLSQPDHRRAISWFKVGAQEAIRRMWQLKRLVEAHGVHVEVIRTMDAGTLVYEDDQQVVAKPHKGERY